MSAHSVLRFTKLQIGNPLCKARNTSTTKEKTNAPNLVDGFAASATIVFGIDDHNKSTPAGRIGKMESERAIGVLAEESGRMEERVAALESVVNFLVSRIGEDQKRPIKSELKRVKRLPDVAATYDDWPVNPMEW